MNKRLSPRLIADAEPAMALEEWEAEGGASAGAACSGANGGNDATTSSAVERPLLELLGAALVSQWNNLPMPLQRAVYNRAVRGHSVRSRLTLKRQMARFLHDHKPPRSSLTDRT
jgi:hypothetical protein